ncbi:MAG: DUF1684 domain-containing protein [Anaerolineae bacterium]|nr:DUF1684 domain-containing protein [Anaerolineae bacterium]
MTIAGELVTLADWRRQVAELYAAVRHESDPGYAWRAFRAARDHLFKTHAQSPLAAEQRAAFVSLPYFRYDPAWRVQGTLDEQVSRDTFAVELPAEGELRYTRVARVHFTVQQTAAVLSLFWLEGYGGGLFLPFRDASNGQTTYPGGRYLYDTIKGADLNSSPERFILDFNFAYNPSCAYNERWVCPLPPPENRLAIPVVAGEQYPAGDG